MFSNMEHFFNDNKMKRWVRVEIKKELQRLTKRLNNFEADLLNFYERLSVIERYIQEMKGGLKK